MVVCNRSLPGGKKLPELSNPGDASDILSGVQFIDGDGEIVTGTMPTKGAQTYTPGTSNQTISSGRYLTGNQTIQGDSDLVPGNIRSGVNIFGVNGTYSGPALPSLSPAASAGQVLSGYQFINASGNRVTGTMPSLGSKTYTPGRTQQTISSGRYLSGNQHIAGDSNLTASNIRQGVRIFGVTGTYAGQSVDLSDYDLYYSYSCSGTSSNVITIRLNQSGFWPSDISFSDITVRSLWMGCLDIVSHGAVQCMAMPLTPEMDASIPLSSAIPRTCVIPRTRSIAPVRFRPR